MYKQDGMWDLCLSTYLLLSVPILSIICYPHSSVCDFQEPASHHWYEFIEKLQDFFHKIAIYEIYFQQLYSYLPFQYPRSICGNRRTVMYCTNISYDRFFNGQVCMGKRRFFVWTARRLTSLVLPCRY